MTQWCDPNCFNRFWTDMKLYEICQAISGSGNTNSGISRINSRIKAFSDLVFSLKLMTLKKKKIKNGERLWSPGRTPWYLCPLVIKRHGLKLDCTVIKCTNLLTWLFFIVSTQIEITYAYTIYFCSVSDVVRMVTKTDIPPHKKVLDLIPSFVEDEDSELVPTIRYLL